MLKKLSDDPNFVRLSRRWTSPLLDMLKTVDPSMFSPHAFTIEAIDRLVDNLDEYWLFVEDNRVVAYGMLRGWQEGHAIPSLGVAVAESRRGQGHGEKMMRFLHSRASERGASRVRLTVKDTNGPARRLYEKMGYHRAADDPHGAWFLDIASKSL